MLTVFEIDVSKTSSALAILVNGEKVQGYTISRTIPLAYLNSFTI